MYRRFYFRATSHVLSMLPSSTIRKSMTFPNAWRSSNRHNCLALKQPSLQGKRLLENDFYLAYGTHIVSRSPSLVMYEAYAALSVAQKLPLVVNCISSHNGCLLAGTKNGYLLRYANCHPTDWGKRSIASLVAERLVVSLGKLDNQYDLQVCRTFSKTSVNQLRVLPTLGVLVTLTDGLVKVHDLNQANFPLVTVVPRCKNISCFSAYEHCQPKGDCIAQLAIAVRKKCYLYTLVGNEFVERPHSNEIQFNDSIHCIALVQSYFIAAVRDEYFHVELTDDKSSGQAGTVRSLFTVGSRCGIDNSLVITLTDRKLFACRRDHLTHFVHYNGKLAAHDGYETISWSEVPEALEYDGVYLLALMSKTIEIRSVKPSLLVQVIELTNAKLIVQSFSGRLYIACATTSSQTDLYLLDSNCLALDNVQRLVREKEYELAIQIAQSVQDSSGGGDEKKRVRDIKLLYAFHLFLKSDYQEAFDIYSEIGADVLYVIGLFPDMLPNKVRETIAYPGPLPSHLPKPDSQRALLALTSFLSEMRTNIASKLEQHRRSSSQCTAGGAFKLSTAEQVVQMKNFLEIVDTTLLKCYLMNNDMLVASLLRLPDNSCNVAESEILLREHKRMSELFLLYERKAMHDKALKVLQEQVQTTTGDKFAIFEKTVSYLQDLGPEHFETILQYAQWVNAHQPQLLLKIFTEDCESTRRLNKFKVLEFIQKECPNNVLPYLEHVINQWREENEKLHTLLGEMYIRKLKKLYNVYGPDKPSTQFPADCEKPTNILAAESRLVDLLKESRRYNAEALFVQLPFYFCYEARAIILDKLKRYDQALAIYTNLLQNFQAAKAYCQKRYSEKDAQASQLYLKLFQYYISPPSNSMLGVTYAMLPSPGRRLDCALETLMEFGKYMDALQICEALSSTLHLRQLDAPLQKIILDMQDLRWETSLQLCLTQTINFKCQKAKMICQNQSVVVNYASRCADCKKIIGNSAFVRFTDGSLVHYYCFKKESPQF